MDVERFSWLLLFYAMQIGAYLLFKFGSMVPARWLPCFLAGNAIGIACMWILMRLFALMNANLAMGLSIGGGFLCGQLALALVFRTSLSGAQYLGVALTGVGLFLLAKG